ncbi:MAG TPA: DUF4344 domain-containing metallopeptidase [Marmoricola sp.]|jgi:hypothetical protein|nr:DUF4344 domain-containing metallopeptidase [Marmoricola sp.]
MRALRYLAPFAALVLLAAGCGSSGKTDDAKPRATKTAAVKHVITVVYDPPPADSTDSGYVGQVAAAENESPDAFAEQILKDGAIDDIAKGLSDRFNFPVDLTIHVTSGEGSPHYDPSTKTVTLYYDFANLTADLLKANTPKISNTELGREWAAVNDFVLVHELGHAFVDVFEIPITGREEDSVDGMATYFFTDTVPHGDQYAYDAANFFRELQGYQGEPDLTQYADEHSLSVQRFYDIACKVAGSSDKDMQIVANMGILPDARLQRCPAEYQQNTNAWSTLLKPHLRAGQS